MLFAPIGPGDRGVGGERGSSGPEGRVLLRWPVPDGGVVIAAMSWTSTLGAVRTPTTITGTRVIELGGSVGDAPLPVRGETGEVVEEADAPEGFCVPLLALPGAATSLEGKRCLYSEVSQGSQER